MRLPRNNWEKLFPNLGAPFIFIHTPKCGGTFIGHAFKRRRRRCPTLNWPEAKGHRTYIEYRDIFRARGQNIHDHHIFTVVRNPWAWHVSWFNYLRSDPGGKRSGHVLEAELFQSKTFSDYIDWIEDPDACRGPQGYITRQIHEWVTDEQGKIQADTILRQETLSHDLPLFLESHGLKLSPTRERKNVSTFEDFRRFYNDVDAERIAKRHRDDIDLFGYTFDGP